MKYGIAKSLYLKFYKPSNTEYVEYLRKYGRLYSIGDNCLINRDVVITDPEYVRIGNNVCLSSCILIGHDASIAVLNRAYNVKLDSVGKIDIKDNVFIGYGAIILPGVTIEPNVVIGAGTVVTKDVPTDSVMAGVPAKKIGSVLSLVEKLEAKTKQLPWFHLIAEREGAYDQKIEAELKKLRVKSFYQS